MIIHKIPEGVLERTFGCDKVHDVHNYVRLDCWGEGSCFFHSVCLLLVVHNKVEGNMATYTLDTPSQTYRTFRVPILHNKPFCESFRQVGIRLRQRLGKELSQRPNLWQKFRKQNNIDTSHAGKIQTVQGGIKELNDPSVWADIWTIRYCAWRLRVNTLFVNPSNAHEPLYCGVENFNRGKHVLFIYWSNHSHFEPIVYLQDAQDAQGPSKRTIKRSFGENHEFVKCLTSQYKHACPYNPIEK